MLAASRHWVNTARARAGDTPASPQAGVITACCAHVASGSPSRCQNRMTRSAVCLASALPSPGPAGSLRPARPGVADPGPSAACPGSAGTAPASSPMPGLRGLGHPVLFPPP